MTTGKTIALTRQTFVGKVMSLLFNMLSRLVITFLPRSKRLFISWLQSPSSLTLEPRKIKSVTVSTVSPSICHEVMGPDAMICALQESISQSRVSSGSSTVGLMVTSSKRTYAIPVPRAPVPAANHCRPVPPQETLTVLSPSLWGPWVLVHTRFVCNLLPGSG